MTQPDQPNPASLLTRADYDRYRRHLDELRQIRDRDLPELLRDARGFVASDAEEEIAQIRDDHVFVEARIAHLETLLSDAHVIADGDAPGIAFPGRIVDVEYTRSGKLGDLPDRRRRPRGRPGNRVRRRRRSARASLGALRGDLVAVNLPSGRAEQLRIVAVRPDDEGLAAA